MPPKDGITVAHFLTVADVERSLRALDDRGDHEAAAMVGAFGRALIDPAFKRPSN
jgi:hypothetical protein